eukprot:GHVS01062212.1.p1 GENE.GHVS01062212.1~~GHVS01062212.1.p1  ORF type:complete len:249 (+),score=34.67 GHVS01062212.1:53-799(+)
MGGVVAARPSPLLLKFEAPPPTACCCSHNNKQIVWGLICVIFLGQFTMPLQAHFKPTSITTTSRSSSSTDVSFSFPRALSSSFSHFRRFSSLPSLSATSLTRVADDNHIYPRLPGRALTLLPDDPESFDFFVEFLFLDAAALAAVLSIIGMTLTLKGWHMKFKRPDLKWATVRAYPPVSFLLAIISCVILILVNRGPLVTAIVGSYMALLGVFLVASTIRLVQSIKGLTSKMAQASGFYMSSNGRWAP